MRKYTLTLITLVAVGSIVAGCGDSGKKSKSNEATATSPPPSSKISVKESDFKFTPKTLTANKSGTVQIDYTNDGKTTHALEIKTPTGEIAGGPIKPGQSGRLLAQLKPGKYEIYCPIDGHKKKGMVGVLVVKK